MIFEQLKRYSQREFGLILVLVCAVLLAPTATYLLVPTVKAVRAAEDSHRQLLAAAQSGQNIGARLEEVGRYVAQLEGKLHGDLAGLPAKELEAHIIGGLQTISWRNRVELVGVEPGEGDSIDEFDELVFDIRLQGDYFDLYNWLRDLNAELGFVVVKEYRMRPLDAAAANPVLVADLMIASYRAKTT